MPVQKPKESISSLKRKLAEARINELVFIGRSLDALALPSGFDACRAVDMAVAE